MSDGISFLLEVSTPALVATFQSQEVGVDIIHLLCTFVSGVTHVHVFMSLTVQFVQFVLWSWTRILVDLDFISLTEKPVGSLPTAPHLSLYLFILSSLFQAGYIII